MPGMTTRTGGGDASSVRICTGEVWVRSSSRPDGSPVGRRRVEVERVVHVHRRMVGREVEREEVVPLGLDLGPGGDGEAELAEDPDDLVDDPGDRDAPRRPSAPRPGIVRSTPAASRRRRSASSALAPCGERRLEPRLELVDARRRSASAPRPAARASVLSAAVSTPLFRPGPRCARPRARRRRASGRRSRRGEERVEIGVAGGYCCSVRIAGGHASMGPPAERERPHRA